MVMAPHEMVREKDVRRLLKNRRFRVSFDAAFADVMAACAEPRKGQVPLSWITRDIVAAYGELHRLGRAHSFEVWSEEGELVGGGFGIAVGPVFVIESQFTRARNASKVGLATLCRHLSHWGFALADAKGHTSHLESLGFRLVPHAEYLAVLRAGPPDVGPVARWTVDERLDAGADWTTPQPVAAKAPAVAA